MFSECRDCIMSITNKDALFLRRIVSKDITKEMPFGLYWLEYLFSRAVSEYKEPGIEFRTI